MPARLRDLFLRPPSEVPPRPRSVELRRLTWWERRRARVAYQRDAGIFRTWVYAALLVILVGLLLAVVFSGPGPAGSG